MEQAHDTIMTVKPGGTVHILWPEHLRRRLCAFSRRVYAEVLHYLGVEYKPPSRLPYAEKTRLMREKTHQALIPYSAGWKAAHAGSAWSHLDDTKLAGFLLCVCVGAATEGQSPRKTLEEEGILSAVPH